MSMLYLTGKNANLLKRATVTASPSALAAYPVAGLSDDDPGTPFVFGSLANDSNIPIDFGTLVNRNFEEALATGWTDASVAGGTAWRESTIGPDDYSNSGTYGCKLTAADATHAGSVYQTIEAAAGEYRRLGCYAKTISGTPDFYFIIYNNRTGKYWNGATWTSTPSGATVTGTLSGAFSFLYVLYRVEDFETCRADAVNMRVQFVNASAAPSTVAIDDAEDVPGVNFSAIIGHNLGHAVSVVQFDPAGVYSGAHTNISQHTITSGAFYSTFAMSYCASWRVIFTGTNHEAPCIGELILGQYQTALTGMKWNFETHETFPSARNIGPTGRTSQYNLTEHPIRSLSMNFSARSTANAAELMNSLWRRSGQGRYPTIIVPIDTEADVYYGHLTEPIVQRRRFVAIYESSMRLQGAPLQCLAS